MIGTRPALGVVLAGGRGKRMGPLTSDRSKAMVSVAGCPMIGRVVEMLARGGCDRMVVVVHRDDEMLIRYLSTGRWAARTRLALKSVHMFL